MSVDDMDDIRQIVVDETTVAVAAAAVLPKRRAGTTRGAGRLWG